MKIKFIKEYRAIGDFGTPGKAIIARSSIGDTADNLDEEDAQWLIDNGFAEEVKEPGGWKPKLNEKYFYVVSFGEVLSETWDDLEGERNKFSFGNVFKTEGAAERWRDYLQAIATVRQDEGVLTPEQLQEKERDDKKVVFIGYDSMGHLAINSIGLFSYDIIINAILFDNETHAQASLDNHLGEWKIIADYDWSRE